MLDNGFGLSDSDESLDGGEGIHTYFPAVELSCSEVDEGPVSSANHRATFSSPPLDLEARQMSDAAMTG